MWKRLGVQPAEVAVLLWGAAVLGLVGFAEAVVQNASETLFNKRVAVELLPRVFLVNSLLLVGTTSFFGVMAARSDRLRLLPRVLLGLGAAVIPLWAFALTNAPAAYTLLVLFSKQLPSIALLVFWIAMADLLTSRQAKRLFAPMSVGLTAGAAFGSFASEPMAWVLGIEGVVPTAAVALALGAWAVRPLRRTLPRRLERGGPAALRPAAPLRPGAGFLGGLWQESGLFRLMFITSACAGLLGPMLYFQFQFVADAATGGAGGENRLLAFYSQFRGWINVAVLLAQLLVTSRVYARIGVPLAAMLSPALYLTGFLGLSLRLTLPVGVAAKAGTQLQDAAVYDPGQRILYALFPERLRSRASAILEGPVKRAGGVIGNGLVMLALALGSAVSVGYLALPIASLWLVVAVVLWRTYPRLLLQASAGRRGLGEAELLDPATLRVLSRSLLDPDPIRCRVAIELVCDAQTDLAVAALARAVRDAPASTRPLLVKALDRLLEASVTRAPTNREAAAAVASVLASPEPLAEGDRADLVQAYGRLTRRAPEVDLAPLEAAAADDSAAVRLAATAALRRRQGPGDQGHGLDAELAAAIASDEAPARRIAREELRAMLLEDGASARWVERLELLASLLDDDAERAAAAEALADVAARHHARAAIVGAPILALREDPDERVCAAVARFAGGAGLQSEVPWLIEQLASRHGPLAASAREGLLALGTAAVDALLVELACGKRRTRDAILPLLGELEVKEESLRELYESEVSAVQRTLVHRVALGESVPPLLLQRLDERMEEGVHTALQLLAAIRHQGRIAELGVLLREIRDPRRRSVLLEAIEASLGEEERLRLMPLLEDRGAAGKAAEAARVLGIEAPTSAEAAQALLADADELTRTIAVAAVARGRELEDHSGVLSPVEIAVYLKSLPVFERLTARQLMDLAKVVQEETHATDTVVVREGEYSDGMFVIVEGSVAISKGDKFLRNLGPKDFFGEIAVLAGSSRSATARSRERLRVLCIRREDLLRLMEELPAIAIAICESLSHLVRKLSEEVA